LQENIEKISYLQFSYVQYLRAEKLAVFFDSELTFPM